MEKKTRNGFFRYVPIWSLVFFALGAVAFAIELIAKKSVALSDFINDTSGVAIRAMLAVPTSIIPFSLAEFFIIASPLLVALIIFLIVRAARKSSAQAIRFAVGFVSCAALIYAVFIFGYGTGYYGTTIDKKMELDKKEVSAEELYETGRKLVIGAKKELENIDFAHDGGSYMPYTYFEMNKKLNAAYKTTCGKYPFLHKLCTNTKPIMLSEKMTYTHLSGVYCFFTGEANVNTNYPDYIVATSAAHEMAHQRGIAREDEANFAAFLVCINSDDPYLRYSGYVDVLLSVLNSLASADKTLHAQLWAMVPQEIRSEYAAYSTFFEKYRENKVAETTEKINNTYIEDHGQPAGTKSYGLVVDLTVAYYKAEAAKAQAAE